MYSKSLTEEIEKIIKDQCFNCSVENFHENADFSFVSRGSFLSEEFIECFRHEVNWHYISSCQKLSESFIEKFKGKVNWEYISVHQNLSESFIEKFRYKVDWGNISRYQKLSEEFIERFQHKVDWRNISEYQKLSESFIEKFKHKVIWSFISIYQKLSESFIEKFQDKVDWDYISECQKLSLQFRKKYNITIDEDNWLYKPVNFKLKHIKERTNYEVIDNKYIIAYKGIRSDNYSVFNFQYKYEIGKTYESHCDCNINDKNSFGLSAWDLEKAKKYCDEKVIKVKIAIKDIGAIVREENKIRCFKFEVMEEVKGE